MARAPDPWRLTLATLQLATRMTDDIQAGVRASGFDDVTSLHGFAFIRIAAGDATTAQLAEYLGVSKQASAQLVDRLVNTGYVRRVAHPRDRRAQLLTLTRRGHACTAAARTAAEAAVAQWSDDLSAAQLKSFQSGLLALTASISTVRPPL